MGYILKIVLIFLVLSLFYNVNTILFAQINQYELVSNNFDDINMKKKSNNTKINTKINSKISSKTTKNNKVKSSDKVIKSNEFTDNSYIENRPIEKNVETLNVANETVLNLEIQKNPLVSENIAINNIDDNKKLDLKSEPKSEQKFEPKINKTKYFSLIFNNEKTTKLDSNQKQFIEKLADVLIKYPNTRLALLSYVSGNKKPEDNLKIAKQRNQFIIDYMTKKGISVDRISKKGVSGLIVKENIELYKSSNIIEIIISEQNKIQKTETK